MTEWVVLVVILFVLPVVVFPLWEWLVWAELQGGWRGVFYLREYENRLTGTRLVRVVDSDGRVVLSFNRDDMLGLDIRPVVSGRPVLAEDTRKLVRVTLNDGTILNARVNTGGRRQ